MTKHTNPQYYRSKKCQLVTSRYIFKLTLVRNFLPILGYQAEFAMAFHFFKKVFKINPRFNHTPETFLAMMYEMQNIGRQGDPESSSAYQLARVFIKIIKVDLYPYKNLDDFFENGTPDFTLTDMVMPKVLENQNRRELKQEIYGKDVDLREDDPLNGDSDGAAICQANCG